MVPHPSFLAHQSYLTPRPKTIARVFFLFSCIKLSALSLDRVGNASIKIITSSNQRLIFFIETRSKVSGASEPLKIALGA